MSVFVPKYLPAIDILKSENIDVYDYSSINASSNTINILILNLMPLKSDCEVDFIRLLSSSGLDLRIEFAVPDSHTCKNTPKEYIDRYYKHFSEIIGNSYDGFIITGAPVEKLNFEDVDYWNELKSIFDWSRTNCKSTLYICWAAFAGLYYHFNVRKHLVQRKISGVFKHRICDLNCKITQGFDDEFFIPHSRFAYVDKDELNLNKSLKIISMSDDAGIYIVGAVDWPEFYITGHSEYSPLTLDYEYHRDLNLNKNPEVPCNYYPDDDVSKKPIVKWRAHANLLINNWLNYYVNKNN